MISRTASCSCGQLGLVAKGEPVRISVCHCLACQRRTGSTFGAQARFLAEMIETHGIGKAYERSADSGNQITFHFCPECGATVYYCLNDDPTVIAVPVGAFADPGFPPPRVSVYEARQHTWTHVPEDVEHYN